MRCKHFVQLWNERLDAASSTRATDGSESNLYGDRILESHTATCADCRQLAAKFMTLERGLSKAYAPPRPSPGLERRILATWHDQFAQPGLLRALWREICDGSRTVEFRIFAALMVLVMASVLMLKVVDRALETARSRERVDVAKRRPMPDNANTPALKAESVPTLNQALATASKATWQLARNASEPAASIGREFVATALPGPFPTTTVDAIVPNPSAASSALERIGGQVVQGARPLSSAARRAFSFLSLPSTEKHPGRRAIATPDKRA